MPTNRTAVTLIHGFLIAANVAAGAINIHFHRHGYIFSFAAAAFILALNIAFQMRYRRLRRVPPAQGVGEISMTALSKAKKNLMKVVKVTHAEWDESMEMVIFRQPKTSTRFLIRPGSVIRERPNRIDGTCFFCSESNRGETTPIFEQMATALLLLKNNPKLFDKWAKHDGAFHA